MGEPEKNTTDSWLKEFENFRQQELAKKPEAERVWKDISEAYKKALAQMKGRVRDYPTDSNDAERYPIRGRSGYEW